MALCSRSCLALFLVVCLATPLCASPLFFGSPATGSVSSTAAPSDFDIDFSVSTNQEASQPTFFDRIGSAVRLVSALAKSFIAVIKNRNNPDDAISLNETADDSFVDFDPFGVEPSETEIDFFSNLDTPTSANVISRGRSLDSAVPDADLASSVQNVNSKVDEKDVVSSSQNEDPKVNDKDAISSGHNEDPVMTGENTITSGQSEGAKVDGQNEVSSGVIADSDFPSADITRAILLGSARLV